MKTIKGKIILCIVACLLFLGGTISGLSAFLSFRNTNQTLAKTMEETGKMSAEFVASELETYATVLYQLAETNVFKDQSTDSGELKERAARTAAEYGFVEIFKAEANGDISGGINIADRDYFMQAKSTGKVAFSDMTVSRNDGKLSVFAAAPIMKNGVFSGTVCAVLDGLFLSDIVNKIRIGESGLAYMIDGKGNSLAHSNPDVVLEQNNSIERAKTDPKLKKIGLLESEVLKGKSVFGPYTAIDGSEKFVALSPVPDTNGWALGVNVNRIEFLRDTYNSLFIMLLIAIACVTVGVILAMYLANAISRPIKLGVDRLAKIAEGDLSSPVPVSNAKDETRLLMDSLGRMVEDLNGTINDVSYHLGEISRGNLTTSLEHEYKGDFQPLGASVKTIIDSLNSTVSQINLSSEQVNSGSEQISSGAQALSQGAAEQASSIEELSATISDISGQISLTAQNAQNANDISNATRQEVEAGNRQMQSMIQAMGNISDSSNEISRIIKTIDDIAFQTNILALNAAVEAARAGSAGKGFAVVADEVRNLAGKSAEAAKNTTGLIEKSIQAVDSGRNIVDDTAKSLRAIVSSTRKTTDLIEEIAKASVDQAQAVMQVTQGIEQISSVVQTNSATAEESAAASEELSAQAQTLRQLVGQFRLKDSDAF